MAITRLGPNQDITAAKIAGQINFKNLIINGDMSLAQRGTSSSGITAGGMYTIDRYGSNLTSIGTWTQSQSTDVPTGQGFGYSLKMDCTTANASLSTNSLLRFGQIIEAQNLQQLKFGTSNAENLTISFWVKSNKTGTYVVWFYQEDDDRQTGKTYTINSANTWEKKTVTISGDTIGVIDNNNGRGIEIAFILGAGTDWTSGTSPNGSWEARVNTNRAVGQTVNLADTIGNTFYITGVQLEADTSASDFEFLPYDVNFSRCARYFYYLGVGNAQSVWLTGYTNTIDWIVAQYSFPTQMRTNSSLTQVGTWSFGNNNGSIGFSRQSPTATTFGFLSTGAASVFAYNPSDGGVQFDAEL